MVDTVQFVTPKTEPRGRTIPIAPWWGVAVKRELDENAKNSKLTDEENARIKEILADDKQELPKTHIPRTQDELAKKLGFASSEVSRARKPFDEGGKPVLEIVLAVSDELKLPYPVLLPETEELALKLAEQNRVWRRELKLVEIAAGVPGKTSESQTLDLSSEHANRSGSKEKKQHKSGRKQRARP